MPRIARHVAIAFLTFAVGVSVVTLWTTIEMRRRSHFRDRAEVWRLTGEYHSAAINRDKAALERILSDDFVCTNTYDGSVGGRTEIVRNIVTKECDAVAIETRDVWEMVGEARAEVRLKIYIPFRCDGSATVEHEGLYRYSFEKRGGRWQITAVQLTPLIFY